MFALLSGAASAQPSGGTVVSGQAGITSAGNTTTINQSSQKAVINWRDFSVGAGGTVQFAQPDAKSITLNRVTGSGASAIDGTLSANGQVWIINPNGVLFGQGAQVNVGGLLATTADITDGDFVAGDYDFTAGPAKPGAAIANRGAIRAANGGSVVLSGAHVTNAGLIQADAGTVVLGGAPAFTLDFAGDNLLRYAVASPAGADSGGNTAADISNSGQIAAAGGKILLTARAAASVLDGVVNNTGIIEAVSAREVNGQIILDAGGGTVHNGGTLDASGKVTGETGGSVQVLGKTVEVADGANISASGDAGGGEILIGGNFRGEGPLANAETTTVGKATISADAITSGDGGQVVVWSDSKTRFGGSISARGGAASGDGGQVETSGAILGIDAGAEVITLAPAGQAGNWLLDPDDLFIVDSGSEDTTLTGGVLAFNGGGTTILTDTIESALLNGNVTLQANNDISVQGSVNVETGNTLELDAGRSILFSGSGSLSNIGTGSRIVLSANDPNAVAANRQAGAGTISMEAFNSVTAESVDLILGANAGGGGIGAVDATVTVNGKLYVETAGYDAFINSGDLVLGNAAHVGSAVDLNGGNLSLTVTGLTQTAPIAVKDLTIGVVGDVSFVNPISLMNSENAISGKVNALWFGGGFGGPNQIEITNSQAITIGDLSVLPYPADDSLYGNYGAIQIETTAGGITIDGKIEAGGITLHAVGDIVETANGLITAHGSGDGNIGGGLAVSSFEGKISLPNANAVVPSIVCVVNGCDSPEEKLNAGQLSLTSSGNATVNFITPVDLYGVITGGAFSLTVFGDYSLNDAEGVANTVYNAINLYNFINAGGDVTLHASGDIVQRTDIDRDVHIETPTGLHATSDNGSLYLDDGGNLGDIQGEDIGFDTGNRIGGDINGYSVFNSAGDTFFTNTVDTIIGGHAYYPIDEKTGDPVPPEYPFTGTPMAPPDKYESPNSTIGGNLKVRVVDFATPENHPVLVIAGRIHAENNQGGYSALQASGDIANNNGAGTIIVGTVDGEYNDLSLISDFGSVGGNDGTSWSFGLGAENGTLNLHAEAENGSIIINPGDLNIGVDGLTGGVDSNYVLIFGNGVVTQNADVTGVITTTNLDVHSRNNVTLDNADNAVSGTADFYVADHYDSEMQKNVASDISFTNSVDTTITRASGSDVDLNGTSLRAGNVTITVHDPSGETTPSLKIGNREYTDKSGATVYSSIDSYGDVVLQADGGISDGYDANNIGSAASAGHVSASGSLTVIAESGNISLANPINAVEGEIDLTAGPTYDIEDPIYSDITFANSVNTTLVRANGGEKFGTYIEYVNDVTILVSDPTGNTNPWLTLGNTSFINEGDTKIDSSINAFGDVILLAGGIVSDGYDPDNGDSSAGAGFVEGETLTVTSAADEIWLQNPNNGFNGLTATTDDKDITITASAWSGSLNINSIDAGAGNVTLAVNNADLIQSGAITAKDLTVSTHQTGVCEGLCIPAFYGVYLDEDNLISGTIQADALGQVFIRNSLDTTVGTSSAGLSFTIISDGDLTIADDATIHGGATGEDDASVLLSADGAFINKAGSDAIDLTQGGRWLVYSDNPVDDVFGDLDSGNTAVWNTVYNGENTIGEEGNRYVFAFQPIITVTSTDVEKTFGKDVTSEVAGAYKIDGLQEGVENAFLGDDAADVYKGTPTVTSAGSKSDADVENSPYKIDVAPGDFLVFGNGYGVSLVSDGMLTVDPSATLYYVADPTTRLYGQSNPTFTGTIEGFIGDDNQQNSTTGTMIFTSDATKASTVGQYAIIGSGLSSQNYAFAQDPGNATALTVDPATLTYTADAKNRTYGAANPSFTGTVTGFVNNETQQTATTGTLAFGSLANKSSGVGNYAIDGSGLSAQNYVFVQAAGNSTALTVNPATLTYTANTANRTYGAANPSFGGTVTGFVNNENQGSATTGTLAFGSLANKSSNVGSYAINGSGLSAQNYVFVQAAGNSTALTVDPATLTYTANTASRVYGDANPAFSGTVTGFVNDETQQSATTGTLAFSSPANTSSGVGNYAINGSGLSAQNYTFAQAAGNSTALTITAATLTYLASTTSRSYGQDNPVFGGSVTGFVNNDTLESATAGTLTFLSPATASSNVGSYAINGSGLSASNYVFVQAEGNSTALTITQATLLYEADPFSRLYGGDNPDFTGTVTGFFNGDTQESATEGTLVFTSEATAGSSVGSYAILGSGLTSQNYTFAQAAGNSIALTINPATLTYTANTASRTYGAANPSFSGTVTGFVNDDTQQSATSGTLTFTSTAGATSNVGNYAIDGSGLSADNYIFVQAAGNATALTIDPATLTYTADAADRTYGAANPTFTGTVTGFVNDETQQSATTGTLVFTSEAGAASHVGSYAIDGSGLSAQNYVFVQAEQNATALTIDPATLTYTADAADRTYGAANPTFTGTVTGFVNNETQETATTGTLAFTSDTNAASNVGSYAIDGSGLSAENYIFVQAAGNATALTIDPATLTYTSDTASRTYGAANPAFSGTVTGFVNEDTQQSATTGTLVFTSTAGAASHVGEYAIDGSGLSAQNYVFVQAEGNATALTIDPATLTYTANGANRTYGAANPSFNGTVTGFVNNDTQQSATTGILAFTSPANASSNVGSYAINGSGLAAQDYVFVQAAGNATALTVDPATLTYTANGASRTYGAANPAFSGTVTGFVNNENQGSATTGTLVFNSPANALSSVGSYAINGSGLSAQNYVFVQAAGNSTALTINPATLTYTANTATRTYGAANPSFSGTVTGFVNNENQASATTGTLAFNSPAGPSSNVGSYAINGSGLSAQNYVFVQSGSNATAFSITPATLTISLTGTVTKIFDGNTTATLDANNYSSLSGILFNDDVALAGFPNSGVYDNANVGVDKLVTVSGLTLTGDKAGNYIIVGVISGPVGIITSGQPDGSGALGPELTGVTVSTIQSFGPSLPPGTVIDALNQAAGNETGGAGNAAPPSTPPNPPSGAVNPLADLVMTSLGGLTQGDPPTSSDSATAYIVESFDNGPPSGSNSDGGGGNVVIPKLLNNANNGSQSGPVNYSSIPGWGNVALWQ